VELERARMDHMQAGYTNAHDDEVLHSLAYVAFQELATRISHRNTGRATGDPVAEQLLARVAADENLHMVFYRNLLGEALKLAPNQAMRAITDVVAKFEMPGANIEGFGRKALSIALAGIYDLRQHRDEVLSPVLRQWDVWNITGLDAEGELAREELAAHMNDLDVAATRFEEKRAARRARDAAKEAARETAVRA
jgi:acyl-[acyl-carrier-protein] desaturase